VIVVGGNSKYDVPLNLYNLAMRNQSVLGVHRGTRKQLQDLVNLVATEQVRPSNSIGQWRQREFKAGGQSAERSGV